MAKKRGLGAKGKKTHLGLSALMGNTPAREETTVAVAEPKKVAPPVKGHDNTVPPVKRESDLPSKSQGSKVSTKHQNAVPAVEESQQSIHSLSIFNCMPGRYQPRRHMDETALNELVQSIKKQGVISPIVVRPTNGDQYEIIAGERRWQAAKLAELTEIPAVVRQLSDQDAMVIGLIENIQREQLNALEEAQAFSRLLLEFKLTHEAIAEAVGKSRTAVSNTMRLLQLAADAKQFLEDGQIQAGHARALLALPKELQATFAKKIAAEKLSVRQIEKLVQQYLTDKKPVAAKPNNIDPDVKALEEKLCDLLATKVSIKYDQKGRGSVQVRFNSLHQLDDILALIEK